MSDGQREASDKQREASDRQREASDKQREASDKQREASDKQRAAEKGAVLFSLRLKLVLMALLLTTLPLGVVGWVLIDVNEQAVSVMSRELQLAVVDDLARTLDEEFMAAEDGLDGVGRALSEERESADLALATAMILVESNQTLDHAAVYDRGGHLIDVIRERELRGVEPPEELDEATRDEAARLGVATGRAVASPDGPRVPLTVPIRVRGEITGWVSSLVSLEPVQRRVERIAAARFPNVPNALFVVDQDLRVLAHPDADRARRLESVAGLGILRTLARGIPGAEHAQSGEFVAEDGTKMVGSTAVMSRRPWIVVVQVPASLAYQSIVRMKTIVLVTVLLAMVLAVLLGVIGARRVTAPLVKLTAFAGDLAARRFDRRVEVGTRDELAVLAGAMSRAAAELRESEERLAEEAAIRRDLGRYLPAELVEKVVQREQDMSLGGVRREITVLFADVVSFTPLTEKLEAEDVVTILNELFTILTGIVFRHGGTVDKFIGDCVMALWGAPTERPDHAARALAAAEDMLRWLEMGNATWKERYGVTIQLALGVHTGEAVVGNIGSKTRMEYTAIGTTVNVAARLESIARPQQILVSEAVKEAAGEGFEFYEVGHREIAGVEGPVHLFELRP